MNNAVIFPWTMQAHKVFRWILIIQLVVSFAIGFATDSLLAAALVGIPVAILPILLALKAPGEAISRHAVGIATQLMTALHVQQAYGMTEMHFQIFVVLAFLFFFRDWKVVVSATVVVAVHHFLFFYLQANGSSLIIVDAGKATFLILLIHAMFAVIEAAVLAVMAYRSHNEAVAALQLAHSVNSITGNGELIDLSESNLVDSADLQGFNGMIRQVNSLIQEVNQVGASMVGLVEKVSHSSHELDKAVDEQDTQVSTIKSAMQNMTFSINEVADLSQNANQIAEQAKQSTDQTRSSLAESSSNIGQLKSTLETTSVAISDLSGKCVNISEVMQSIKSVAEQTNLLALNAAIESARAGEHGRGFAVVADEVRNLAIKSKESAEEIELITSQLTESANNSVVNMENCVKIVALAVSSSDDASNNMASVMNSIDSVNRNVTTVAGSATEQAQTSESISASAEELYSLFTAEKQQVDALKLDITELSAIAEQLRAQLKHFKVG